MMEERGKSENEKNVNKLSNRTDLITVEDGRFNDV